MPGNGGPVIHDIVSEDKDPVPLLPLPVEDVADLLPAGVPPLLVAAADHSVNAGEEGGAEVAGQVGPGGLQAGASRLVLFSPSDNESH